MKPVTLEQFYQKVTLLPKVVAEAVLEERYLPLDEVFISSTEQKVLDIYNANPTFRKKLGNSDRDYLYKMVNSWLDAYLKNKEAYLERMGYYYDEKSTQVVSEAL